MLVSVYARDRAWLFNDFLEAFDGFDGVDGVEVRGTFDPIPEASAFICIRTDELDRSPDLSRTILQCHDLWPRDLEHRRFGALSLVHEAQKDTLSNWETTQPGLCLPIGARRAFTLRESMPEQFTVGWVGREMRTPDGRDQKRPGLLAEALRDLREGGVEAHCHILGPHGLIETFGLHRDNRFFAPDRGSRRTPSFDQLQRFYHAIDALIVTSLPEPGPLGVFEALRCGIPVIFAEGSQPPLRSVYCWHSTKAWASEFCPQSAPSPLHAALSVAARYRQMWFDERVEIRASMPYLQEDWIAANVRLAVEVAGG